jgi:phosphatidylglycerol:prolipoprotein diacylglycerol transferase
MAPPSAVLAPLSLVLPYWEQPTLNLGPVSLHAFGALVAVAILVGHGMVVKRAERFGYNGEIVSDMLLWMILIGFYLSHVIEVVVYQPENLSPFFWDGVLLLLKFWEGISSWGGWIGGVIGLLIFMRVKRMGWRDALQVIDFAAYAVPFAWVFGRLGCTVAHDHPGVFVGVVDLPAALKWLEALAFDFPDGPRFDLGFLEFLYLLLISGVFWFLDRRRTWPVGFFLALYLALYSPVRWGLDTLRIHDVTYASWTPGQYFAAVAFALSAALVVVILKRGGAPFEPSPHLAARADARDEEP